ncbi:MULTISPECIES: hypothetical protein [Yersinia]|uniref:Uncharacterized protein n=1 Tax=Yersinia pekkanenii TaxID=1288385 RepID=A0A0T9PR69_9GAMM|nr:MULTISPECIES: hypothetical protein [Yersinia]CNH78022.1 Uncharacterised protein [Yersinia pekkanenii]CNK54230.1 Uncharacterised protein [Yersinia pseudotuberculosis]CRY69371.1 Uncharacterised protein [Yersinia pekkanenii]
MASPKLKVDERFNELSSKWNANQKLDDISFIIIKNELSEDKSLQAVSTLALAYATYSKLDKAIELLEESLPHGDANYATLYCSILYRQVNTRKLNRVIYELANNFDTKWLTYHAAGVAYAFGKISLCNEFLDKHIRLLSNDEGREAAMKYKDEVLSDMASAYEKSGCTSEQYELIGSIVEKIKSQHEVPSAKIEVSGDGGGSYVVDIDTDDVGMIVKMNKQLAEAICMDERLDNCNLIARFTPDRHKKPGVSYVYN